MVHFVRLRQGLWSLENPVVLGILNATPDSFYADGRALAEEACSKADSLIEDGADWIDVGGCSTRPASTPPSEEEEWQRIAPVLDYLAKKHSNVPVSVDTYRASVAQRALDAGASLINDVSAGLWDPKMAPLVAASQVPYIAMHHQGRPDTMQLAPQYTNLVQEVFGFFAQRLSELRSLGVIDVLLDPGFGFGKTAEHNFNLLDQLEIFHALGCPLLVGVSRKSMIYKSLDTTPELALNGTTAAHAWALDRGAHVLRVHDPKAAKETVRLHRLLTASRPSSIG